MSDQPWLWLLLLSGREIERLRARRKGASVCFVLSAHRPGKFIGSYKSDGDRRAQMADASCRQYEAQNTQ
ncbi:MAG: hypothetical protein U5M72_09790 [Pseudomonas sp.]|nr:hypothetical protein [Pseudomonas sp.]